MIRLLIAGGGILVVLAAAEMLWHREVLRDERSRKFVHVLVGCYVAFWPFFLSWGWIQLLSLGLFVGAVLSSRLNIFRSVHNVERHTMGEALYALAIGVCALFEPPAAIFTIAILHLALADGLAAVVGKRFGTWGKYKVFGHNKTIIGSLTFCFVSAALLGTYASLYDLQATIIPLCVWLPIVLAIVENLTVRGFDNLVVPIIVLAALGFYS